MHGKNDYPTKLDVTILNAITVGNWIVGKYDNKTLNMGSYNLICSMWCVYIDSVRPFKNMPRNYLNPP